MAYYNLLVMPRRNSMKVFIFLIICVCAYVPFGSHLQYLRYFANPVTEFERGNLMVEVHDNLVDVFYSNRVAWNFSNLGQILFNREDILIPSPNANRKYIVLVWKYWDWLKSRHVYNFGKSRNQEAHILDDCSVKNCKFTGDDKLLGTADAVLIHLQRGLIPEVKNRNPNQRWIFLNDESPRHAFTLAKKAPSLQSLYNVFNWSMTYRSDSDVPVPYGRTLPLDNPIMPALDPTEISSLIPNWDRKKEDKIVAVLMSNCGVKARNDFLAKLRKYIDVDVFGKCSDKEEYKTSCPGHFKSDCDPVAEYLFYLVLENTSCFQYLTEKVFYHAYSKGAIPVIFGPSLEDVETLLPPNSYLFADAQTSVKMLAKTIKTLASNYDLLVSMHMWRNHFRVVNEHGYFGSKSYHLCRLCQALNYNDKKSKVYGKELIDKFLDPSQSCYDRTV